jgi:hypothetical protein
MSPEDIEPGVEIIVPAGADWVRKLPYRLRVTHASVSKATGAVTVTGRLQRMNGAPTAKKRTAAVRTVTINPAKLLLAAGGDQEKTPEQPQSLIITELSEQPVPHHLAVNMTGVELERHEQADIEAGGTGWLDMPIEGPAPVAVGHRVEIEVTDAEPGIPYVGHVAAITGNTAHVQLD